MDLAAKITIRLEDFFSPESLELENQSHLHAEHNQEAAENGQTHFFAVIVSVKFIAKSRLQRQRMVYDALGDLFDTTPLHAFAMKTLAPEEDNDH